MPRTSTKTSNANEILKSNAKETFEQSSPLVETVKMISRGLLPEIPKEITIRAIKRKDKKKILMGNIEDPLLALLQECIVAPTDFNVYNLLGIRFKTGFLFSSTINTNIFCFSIKTTSYNSISSSSSVE